MDQQPPLNEHNKQEHPPMHTAEHILNQTMVQMFGCGRSFNAHIEKKKSKCDYRLPVSPTEEQVALLAQQVNEVIARRLPVVIEYVDRDEAAPLYDLGKLPEVVGQTLRIVKVGDYDACPCIGTHVENTSQIGLFRVLTHGFQDGVWRVRWKVIL